MRPCSIPVSFFSAENSFVVQTSWAAFLTTKSKSLPLDGDPYLAAMHEYLTLRVADEDGSLVTLIHRFDLRIRNIRRANKNGITEQAFPYADGNFMENIEDVADRLFMPAHELVAYIDRAARVFPYVEMMGA